MDSKLLTTEALRGIKAAAEGNTTDTPMAFCSMLRSLLADRAALERRVGELEACVRIAKDLQYQLTDYCDDFFIEGEEVSIYAIGDRFRRALGEKPFHEDIPPWPAAKALAEGEEK